MVNRTKKILQWLQLFIITRGLLVALNSIVLLILFLAWCKTSHWFPFFFFESKLHVISIVAMLNA
ncbi:hypothetical protein L208DRAFT_23028 [Tricholoma matsutake]|nr:hypothetical protein L208DRAFT_23028 [Tricholoma matsutake 945]